MLLRNTDFHVYFVQLGYQTYNYLKETTTTGLSSCGSCVCPRGRILVFWEMCWSTVPESSVVKTCSLTVGLVGPADGGLFPQVNLYPPEEKLFSTKFICPPSVQPYCQPGQLFATGKLYRGKIEGSSQFGGVGRQKRETDPAIFQSVQNWLDVQHVARDR